MKLRTEMVQVDGEMRLTLGASPGRYSAREHDAMAAHALLQALDEADNRDEFVTTSATIEWIGKRADEILANWMGEE